MTIVSAWINTVSAGIKVLADLATMLGFPVLLWQLCTNIKVTKAGNTQNLVEIEQAFHLEIAKDKHLTEIWYKGIENCNKLDNIEQKQFDKIFALWLALYENDYHQHIKNLLDNETF